MSYIEQIESLLGSLCSLFYLGSPNHWLMVKKCVGLASKLSMEVYAYNISEGVRRPGGEEVKDGDIDPIEMLNRILGVNHRKCVSKRKLFLLEHFDLLLENRGQVFPRSKLEDNLYGWNKDVDSNTIEVHIHHLRKKLGSNLIRTVRGVGYVIDKQ